MEGGGHLKYQEIEFPPSKHVRMLVSKTPKTYFFPGLLRKILFCKKKEGKWQICTMHIAKQNAPEAKNRSLANRAPRA
jgi:hypothetical protein